MKMIVQFIPMQIKLIFTTMILHLASFWKWEFLELGDGPIKVTRPSFFFFFGGGGVPSYFEALWYPHLYFYHKSNT